MDLCMIHVGSLSSVVVLAGVLTLAPFGPLANGDESPPAPAAGDYPAAFKWLAAKLSAIETESDQKLLVVWLFDGSESMQDDRYEISELLPELYEGLGDGTETAVVGFGSQAYPLTDGTVTGIKAISHALDRIRPDGGKENMCHAVGAAAVEYRRIASSRNLHPVLIVVTDESPSDSRTLEDTIAVCQKSSSPVFVLGSEAVFGKTHARIRWVDPVFQLAHWLQINRGPDAASPERLNWDGFGPLQDNVLSGFGPYAQERLARATGGGFFLAINLPQAEGRLPKLRLAMDGYEPEWVSRREYEETGLSSEFRSACRGVIKSLNARTERELQLRRAQFSTDPAEFQKQAAAEVENAARAWTLLNASIRHLESVRDLRAAESSRRWQANYDLLYAQCLCFRARMPQYVLALQRQVKRTPQPDGDKHNRWSFRSRRDASAAPAADEFDRLGKVLALNKTSEEFIKRLASDRAAAELALQQVINNHPETPWAAVAKLEKNRGFGLQLKSHFHDPRYQDIGKRIKLPNL